MASKKKKRKRRRRRNKGRFSFLLKGLTILAVFAAMTMGATVFFQLEQVAVTGNTRYTQQEIERISGLCQGDNLFRINKYEIKEDILQALPYVEDVNITRRLPNTIQIEIQEWDAVARIYASGYSTQEEIPSEEVKIENVPEDVPQQEEIAEDGTASGEEIPKENAGADGTEIPKEDTASEEPEQSRDDIHSESEDQNLWLMSVGGRILERALPDSPGILIKGLTALAPKAGTPLAVSQDQQDKLDALLLLMEAIDARGCMEKISEIDLSASAGITMRYEGRFLVKLPMAGDFPYCLHALEKVVEQRADNETGTMDLTRKDYAVVYSPE